MSKLDQDSAIPIYHQIAVDLRRRISSREWNIDDRIPSGPELATEYGVNHMTINQALTDLIEDGIIVRQRGRGTFIKKIPPPLVHRLSFPISFTLHFKEMGLNPSARLLQVESILASSEIAKQLHLAANDRVASFKRILLVNDQPMAINHSFLPDRLCPGITTTELVDSSIALTLSQRYGLDPTQSENWLKMVLASEDEAKILETEPGTPLFLLTTLSQLEDNTPVEYSTTAWVDDRMQLYFQAK